MKRQKTVAILGFAAMLLLASCSTSQSAVNDLRSFQQEIEVNGAMYTIKDWKKAAKSYARINKRIYKHYSEYTPQQLQEVGKLNGQCAASFAKATTQSVASKAQGAVGIIKGIVDGVKESFGLPQDKK